MNLRELLGKIIGKPSSEPRAVLRQAFGEFLGTLGADQVRKALAKNSGAEESGEKAADGADLREQIRAFFTEATKGVTELTAAVRKELEKDEEKLPEDVRAEIFRDLRMMPSEETENLMGRFEEARKRHQGARFLRCLSLISKDESGSRRSDLAYLNSLSGEQFENAMAILAGFSQVQETISGVGEKLHEATNQARQIGGEVHSSATGRVNEALKALADWSETLPGARTGRPNLAFWRRRRSSK